MRPTFVFDGDCAFCTLCANFVNRWIPTSADVVPWQRADLAELGVSKQAAQQAVQWVAEGREPLAGPEAIGALLRSSNLFWKPFGWVLALPPVRAAAWPLYRLVARNRHHMPGGTAACALPVDHPAATPVTPAPVRKLAKVSAIR
ncbi:DCC1-like thiol-disulfide oxidoreductase family protein [Hamadaea sp. NPDC050747]|uniref:thiol-disulfide oxidoreductase DCC family protein n=1 Tax=Hamadaea sp. NPDC050747 TaxID=3155789 RepID=UPI003404B54A